MVQGLRRFPLLAFAEMGVHVHREGRQRVPKTSRDGEDEIDNKGGRIGVNLLNVQTQGGNEYGVDFSFIDIDTDHGEIDFGKSTIYAQLQQFKGVKVLSDGSKFDYGIDVKLAVHFVVDKVKVAKWLAEQFAKEGAAALGIGGAFIIGGIAAIAAAYAQAVQGKELAEAIDGARARINEFCNAYASTLEGSDDWSGSTEWGPRGASTALTLIKGRSKDAIKEQAKERDLRSEAFAVGWPMVKHEMYEAWKEAHPISTFFGGAGGGLRTLKFILEDPRQNRYTAETHSSY